MRQPPFYIRAIGITIALCVAVYAAASLADKMIRRRIDNSLGGEISRRMQSITPDVEQRDREVEALTQP